VFDAVDFLLALALPGLVIVRVELLLGRESDSVDDYRERFYRVRIPFFSVGLASMTMLQIAPWIFGSSCPRSSVSFRCPSGSSGSSPTAMSFTSP
jgi:hypothetical protein